MPYLIRAMKMKKIQKTSQTSMAASVGTGK